MHETPASRRYRARPRRHVARDYSCTVVIPCLNEAGNVSDAVRRVPVLGTHTELIFVDGGSTDGTVREIECLIRDHPARDIKLLHQCGDGGKAAAVFEGFDAASGDIVIILDADLTVAPEDLPRFHFALSEGVARFANGDRLAFPMEAGAMPGTNRLGNRIFASVLSTLTGTRLGDTLCGTKALFREDWQRLRVIRADFGGHDPWGDFDLLLGAAALGLTIVDVPIRYHARTAGESKMRPYRHGMALARTCIASLGAHSRAG
jgi:glycosyltransferase involved in cell wall biosynthesis